MVSLRRWLTCLVVTILTATVGEAHVVEQIFVDISREGADWQLEVLFDAGYAKPEWRGDPDSPPPTRDWLSSLGEQDYEALRKEALAYLSECLVFESAEGKMATRNHFPDFDQSPPDFPDILNDGAYLRIQIQPDSPDPVSRVVCSLAEGDRPKFVFKRSNEPGADKPTYLTLRPGESFALLPGDGRNEITPVRSDSLYIHSLKEGFLHVLPGGLDHVLFILALFLLQRDWKSLLWQSLAFTAAHTLTLGLTATGIIAPKSSVVEIMIALSIAVLALENLFQKQCSCWRILLVFGFGLIHGMGFAQALSAQLTPGDGFLTRLVVTNLGVELAQITILGLAWLLTARWHESSHYRTFRTAGNIAIALVAVVWLLQRFTLGV